MFELFDGGPDTTYRGDSMLDPWIIEDLMRREQERREDRQQERVEVPLPPHYEPDRRPATESEDRDRGVTIIDI